MSRRAHPGPWRVEPHPTILGRWMVRDSAGGWVATCAEESIATALLPVGSKRKDTGTIAEREAS